MAISEKQRQKKQLKKQKKRRLLKKIANAMQMDGVNASRYATYSLHECLVPDGLFETGLANIIFARKVPGGQVAVAAFVVDVFCLGVKDALFKVASESDYENTIKSRLISSHEGQNFENVHPTCARKIIEGAVAYARDLGFSPHPDYKKANPLFGDIDASACPVKYEFGSEGKPLYIRGPNESPGKSSKIVEQLHNQCGEGGYDYFMGLDEDFE